MLFTYFSPGIYYVYIHTTMRLISTEYGCQANDESLWEDPLCAAINVPRYLISGLYAIVVIMNIIISLGNKPK
jgi:hypothetical protein